MLTNHFKTISSTSLPQIYYNHIPTLVSEEENIRLLAPPNDEEIFKTLKSMENWSAPRPEGFQVGLYKSQWSTVGGDVCDMVNEFFSSKHVLEN